MLIKIIFFLFDVVMVHSNVVVEHTNDVIKDLNIVTIPNADRDHDP